MFFNLFKRTKKRADDERPIIIAHRGARKAAPENTIAAFKKAEKMGFDGVEMDIVLTKDLIPVVFHGDNLSHSTRESGLICEMMSENVLSIDAGGLFDKKYAGENIPSLKETLEYLSTNRLFINLELKRQPRKIKGVEKIVANLVKEFDLSERVLISSFSPWILKRFSKAAPEIPTSLLTGPHPFFFLKTLLSANMLSVSAINPILQYTSDTLVKFAHARDWRVYVWAANTKQEYQKAIEMEIDGIITDEPDLLKYNR